MRLLDGKELAGYIKERHAKEVRRLKQAEGIEPKLAIIKTKQDEVIDLYLRVKSRYGEDIGVGVEVFDIDQTNAISTISNLNEDKTFHGIIVQLPLNYDENKQEILNSVSAKKDVDGLAENSAFTPATPLAIQWLLAGYNVDLPGKNIVIVGRGQLVGAPLEDLFKSIGLEPIVLDENTEDISEELLKAEIIITATGVAGLIKPQMIPKKCVVVDAGVSSSKGVTVGDLDPEVYERDDLTITPVKGGVGPLTVTALFENLLLAARNSKN